MPEKLKVLFVGTSEFAVPIFEKLAKIEMVELVGVITQPDKPVGRHHTDLQPSPVGGVGVEIGDSRGFEVYKPEKLADEAEIILGMTKPDIIIVAAYGQMIPKSMLEYPRHGCINIHGSLLPKLRGAVPVPMAILQGLEKTGISFQKMVEELDAGDVITSFEIALDGSETAETLMGSLADLATEKLEEVLFGWTEGSLKAISQNHSEATFCSQQDISKEKAQILPGTKIEVAERMVRAFFPWPVAWGFVDVNGEEKRLKIFRAKIGDIADVGNIEDIEIQNKNNNMPNKNTKILQIVKEGKSLFVILDGGLLELEEIQLEGKERRSASDYQYLA